MQFLTRTALGSELEIRVAGCPTLTFRVGFHRFSAASQSLFSSPALQRWD
jgi:hypothetical protein